MTKKQLAYEVIERLKTEYPDAGCTLDYDDVPGSSVSPTII
jgi:endonuclease III